MNILWVVMQACHSRPPGTFCPMQWLGQFPVKHEKYMDINMLEKQMYSYPRICLRLTGLYYKNNDSIL